MSRNLLIVFFLLILTSRSWGQSSDSLASVWKKAKVTGQLRHYWMASVNQGDFKDFNAAALGGKIGVTSGSYRGFSVGAKVYTSFNVGISDLSERAPATNRLSRYELGLFDVANPNNRFIFLLGEAYLQYSNRGQLIKIGRMLLKTPMLNPQDGRMIPTLEQGIWYQNTLFPHWELTAGYIHAIAPRSTAQWYKTQNSVGWYPEGRSALGEAGNYQGNITSPGLFIQNISFQPNPAFQARLWNYAFVNVFNALYADVSLEKTWSSGRKLRWEGQYIWETPWGDGGNSDPSLTYFSPDFQTHLFGLRSTYSSNHQSFALAFTRILPGGQYLFPREWGRDALYTFQKRERQEGFADSWSVLLESSYSGFRNIRVIGGYGFYHSQDVRDSQNNKYGIPAYHQLNLNSFYDFKGDWDKLGLELLVAYKIAQGNTYDDPRFVSNKVNIAIFNLIFNYDF